MLIKAVALSLALLFGIGIIIPLTTNNAEAGAHRHRKHKQRYKKYSKAWWRAYHRRMKRRREAAARWRQMRLRQIRTAKQKGETAGTVPPKSKAADSAPAVLPTGEAAPQNWKKGQQTAGELQFRVDDDGGSQVGSAAISVVGAATGEDSDTARVKTVGGVATTSLRRTVIDRMVRENGFVMNDYQKEVGGKKVYVVVAQSQDKAGKAQARMFYFTESEGRIYSVATNAPTDSAERLASETEKVLNSLQSHSRTQQADLRP